MNSFTEFTGMFLFTTMVVAYSAVPAIGTTSFIGSNAGLGVHRVVEHQRADIADHQRVAVGLGLEQFAQADHAVGARLVLDDDRLVELGAQRLRPRSGRTDR